MEFFPGPRAERIFSECPRRPQEEARKASEELLEGEMPPAAHRLMHAHARLGTADRDRLAQGLAKTLGASPNTGQTDASASGCAGVPTRGRLS